MTTRTRDAAALLAEAISQRIGEPRYLLWFAPHTRFDWEQDDLRIGVPNRHFQEWLQRTFGEAVREAAAEVFERPMQVRFVIDPELFQAARRAQNDAPGPVPAPTPAPRAEKKGTTNSSREESTRPPLPRRARRWHKLSEFVVGPCNRVAHASALSVVESPGETANPLVLYGTVGTGKTHLLEGIYAGIRRTHPDWRVTYITSEDFTNRFLQAFRHDRLSGFRRQFRECDVLLVDDLHFLATKKATQEEFLHTFDTLIADGRQLVVTTDCHPRLSDDFTPELVDRLLGGAVWSLSPPEAETRLAILRARVHRAPGDPIPDEVLVYLSEQLRGNVRELEGAIQSVRHYSRVTRRAIDVMLVREALADLLRHAIRVVQVSDVDQAVCAVLRLEPGTLQGPARAWAVSHPRMVAMYLARKHTASSYSDIGKHFGGRNHSTVVAAEKKVREWLTENLELSLGERRIRTRELVERVERSLLR